MSLTRLAKPTRVNGNVTPDEVRAYIERCRSLWLLSSRQICKDITWGTKIEMLFRALDDDWCQQFRFALTERIQNKISTAATGTHAEYSEHVGEALIEYTITEMLTFVATHSAQIATSGKRPIAEVNYTDKGGKGKGGGKGGNSRGSSWRTPAKGPERVAYFANETDAQKAVRLASRAGKDCSRCGGKNHFSCDPECKGKKEDTAMLTEFVIYSESDSDSE